jgi:hypothetical protein
MRSKIAQITIILLEKSEKLAENSENPVGQEER